MHRTSSKWPAWSLIAARAAVLLLGLVALAIIGRVAAAHASSSYVDAGDPVPVAVLDVVPDASVAPSPPSEPAPPSPLLTPPPPHTARATTDDPVYLNYASAEQMRRLPGIGAKRADAIVALRAKMGRFQRVEDLLRVKGIGRATVKKLRTLVRFDLPEAGVQ